MNSSKAASNEPEPTGQKKKRRYLSAEKKFQIYLEAQRPDQPVGGILRREGMFSTDLARIRQQVREGALLRLGAKPGRKVELVSTESYEKLKADLGKRNVPWPSRRSSWPSCEKKRMGVRGTDSRHLAACGDQTSHPDRDCHFPRPGRFRPAQLRDSGDLPSPDRALAGARAPGSGFGGWHPRSPGSAASTAARGNRAHCGYGQEPGVCGSIPSDLGRHRWGKGPVLRLLFLGLSGLEGSQPDGSARPWWSSQRPLAGSGSQRTDRSQSTVELGHQLPDDNGEGDISVPLPAAR